MTASREFDLVCIGSGPAGQRAAVQAAKLGKRAAVIERQGILGGGSVTVGTIPSKTFREAVLAVVALRARSDWTDSDPPPTAIELFARVQDVIRRESRVVEKQLSRNGVTLIRGEAEFVEPHRLAIKTREGTRGVTTEKVLIAVGTEPTTPHDIPVDGRRVITSDQILDIDELPRSLAVVGAGVIGIEYASMFAALGVQTTLIDKRERPLEFLDDEIVDDLIHQMRNAGVTFRLSEEVARIEVTEARPDRASIKLASGKHIVADTVLYAIGRTGATGRVNLGAAGLTADPRGRLRVDAHFRTEVEGIYAAGDVIGFPSLAATSSEQGRTAACFMFGAEPKSTAARAHFPIGIYAIPEISMVGRTEQELTVAAVPYETGVARYREIARGQILGDDTGLVKLIVHRDTRKLLGVHAIGTGATELIHVGQAVLALDGGLDYFLDTVFNYPTLAECYKVAALDAQNKLVL